jgi:restriction endonuclease S subunit
MPDRLLKIGWQTHSFDEMAMMVNDRIDNPSEADVDYYVGLEHLDADSLVIRRWGSPSDVAATKLRFRAGDIIFGRRRVYQRKLAVANFDGICSAHAMVLRAKPAVALPEFLPYFMQSDLFMARAKEISVGSLSPTINWNVLAKERFLLPPTEEQRRIAQILRAASTAVDALHGAIARMKYVHKSILWRHFDDTQARGYWKPLKELSSLVTDGTHQPPAFASSGVPFLLVGNLADGKINWSADKHVSPGTFEHLSRAWRAQRDDVLYSLVGSYGVPAMVDRDTPFTFQRHIGLIRTDRDKLIPKFLYWYLKSPAGIRQAHTRAEGLAQKTITLTALRSFNVPAPSVEVQRGIVAEIDRVQEGLDSIELRLGGLRAFEKRLAAAAVANHQ